jgi:hypothetical protein
VPSKGHPPSSNEDPSRQLTVSHQKPLRDLVLTSVTHACRRWHSIFISTLTLWTCILYINHDSTVVCFCEHSQVRPKTISRVSKVLLVRAVQCGRGKDRLRPVQGMAKRMKLPLWPQCIKRTKTYQKPTSGTSYSTTTFYPGV